MFSNYSLPLCPEEGLISSKQQSGLYYISLAHKLLASFYSANQEVFSKTAVIVAEVVRACSENASFLFILGNMIV